MKKLLLSAILVIALSSCKENSEKVYVQEPVKNDIIVTPTNSSIGDNLDLQSLGELVKQCNSAEEIENKLNSSGSINNLDLDGDGQVDFIKVNEVNDSNGRGFVFLVDTPNGSEQVATITLSKSGDVANLSIQGNPVYYGNNSYYSSSHLVRDMLIMNYLFSPYHRPLYISPYRYGHYPRTYRTYRSTSRVVNRSTTTTRTTRNVTRPITKSSSSYGSSTYKSRPVSSATERVRSLSSPTSSKKSFGVTSSAKSRPVTSGFGNKSSYKSSSSRSSSRSSSFGSSSRSRSSSFGSSSRSSSRSRR